MSLRTCCLVAALLFGVGCGSAPRSDEPTTAKEKLRREAKAKGEDDGGKPQWGSGWRYQGDRDTCFFTTGRKCFKTENAACQAVRCRAPKKCTTTGAAPATVGCK